jgi:hypothetical protein
MDGNKIKKPAEISCRPFFNTFLIIPKVVDFSLCTFFLPVDSNKSNERMSLHSTFF